MKDLIFIGGGLVGSAAAWQAVERGVRVYLYEMQPPADFQPMKANWGILPPLNTNERLSTRKRVAAYAGRVLFPIPTGRFRFHQESRVSGDPACPDAIGENRDKYKQCGWKPHLPR